MIVRWTRWTTAAAMLLCIGGLVFVASCASNTPQPMTQAQKVERGMYLVSVASCNDCHTPGGMYGAPDTTRLLSGSEVGWRGPWGVSYPRNLTPDQETGIGSWSEDDIVNTIRTGHRPDGSALLPPMPWPNFVHMTDDDAHAIAAYLKSLPPVSHKVPDVVPPDGSAQGPEIAIPPPSAWDAPQAPPTQQ
jgi:mono/diheme cytochrome c family protein